MVQTDITNMNERGLTRIRNEKIDFVFQFFNLITTLTALENVALPLRSQRKSRGKPTSVPENCLQFSGWATGLPSPAPLPTIHC